MIVMSDIDAIAEVLREHGITETADTLHEPRCRLIERFGECTCFAELLTAIEGVLVGGDVAEAAQVGSGGTDGVEAGGNATDGISGALNGVLGTPADWVTDPPSKDGGA